MERTSPLHAPLSVVSHTPLAPDRLRMSTDSHQLRFDPHEKQASTHFSYHQPRAEKALTLGIRMRNAGHIFLCGPTGTARKAIIETALKQCGSPLADPIGDSVGTTDLVGYEVRVSGPKSPKKGLPVKVGPDPAVG